MLNTHMQHFKKIFVIGVFIAIYSEKGMTSFFLLAMFVTSTHQTWAPTPGGRGGRVPPVRQ